MTSGWSSDWLFWLGGGAIALTALVLFIRTLIGDRPRGRRRCPKCWYDMSGTPDNLRCSECGCTAANERKLKRTRRSWLKVCGAVLLLLIGAGLSSTPGYLRAGWPGAVPSTILISMMPDLEKDSPAAFKELCSRMDAGSLWEWQWGWLIDRCTATGKWQFKITTRNRWPASEPLGCHRLFEPWPTGKSYLDNVPIQVRIRSVNGTGSELTLGALDGGFPHRYVFDEAAPPPMTDLPGTFRSGESVEFDVVFERAVLTPTPAAAPSRPRSPLAGPSMLPGPTAMTWTTLRSERIRLPVQIVDNFDQACIPVRDNGVDRQIRERVQFVLTESGLDLRQQFSYELANPTSCAVRIELLRDGEECVHWNDWLYLHAGKYALRWKTLTLPPELRLLTADARKVHDWQIRVRDDPSRALWATFADYRWAGTLDFPLTPQVRDRKQVFASADSRREIRDDSGDETAAE